MKKKLIAILLIIALMLTACSGGGKDKDPADKTADPTAAANAAPTDAQAAPTTEPTTAPEPTEEPDTFEGKTLDFDFAKKYQTIDGFGAAFTWYAERLLRAENSEGGFDALFNDLKLNILRFKNEYEYNIEDKAENAVTMASYYKEARERAALYGEKVQVLLCCWSPPAKLKSDNSIDVGSGTLKKDELGNYCYDEYAAWWTEAVKYYRSFGIQIDYVSIQNEVDFAPDDYEGCLFAAKETDKQASYSKAFLAVYRAFKAEFGDDAPLLIGPETMSCVPTTLKSYMKEALEEEPDSMYGYGYHLYVGGTSDSKTMQVTPSSYFDNFSMMPTLLGDKPKWQTEFYIGHGIQTAELINAALTQGEMNAYIYWSGVWADSTPNNFESADLIEVNNAREWRTSANYWALRHFSEFIRPGYVRIDAISGYKDLRVSAFANEVGNKLAIVIVNRGDEEISYRVKGKDYTITDSTVYQSVFGDECESADGLYANLGPLGKGNTLTIPAKSVTTIDITGYYGDTEIPVAAPEIIKYDNEVITEFPVSAVPTEDVTVIDTSFEANTDINGLSSFGSSVLSHIPDGGKDGNGCLKVSQRAQDWNGVILSGGYFEHYGYMLRVSYDCMMEKDTEILSCTSSFDKDGSTNYPDGENLRVVATGLKAGEWQHVEGYMTMYSDMDPGTFKIYWESSGNTDDIFLDNVKVQILYTMPAGRFADQ
jgi:glucuronoarabinoxylan endo-1,4-beta-xylanase